MHTSEDIFSALADQELAERFRNAGPDLKDEAKILGVIIRNVLASEGQITNKAIIINLIRALESTHDDSQAQLLRQTLEIVVGVTPDD
ncbi:biofilm development regulator YmgB/AriR family protein [Pantoea sp. EA-12]|uniref:biofilm development regulator YmgB/AriR family protein n=1 Tax=Pantoea sp. EA-12 TaxID=3043303 RepID=UPI0024B59DBD|nr:biofilm development regulator YmgB/AriR family protein [Pantoea sp. EA-12]MDI9221405.1 biofilm development regulator YmgB/AriR family protein [Pantoea sp. EA-12]